MLARAAWAAALHAHGLWLTGASSMHEGQVPSLRGGRCSWWLSQLTAQLTASSGAPARARLKALGAGAGVDGRMCCCRAGAMSRKADAAERNVVHVGGRVAA